MAKDFDTGSDMQEIAPDVSGQVKGFVGQS